MAAEVTGKAKRCILLWMNGGASQIDTFDPKPQLKKFEGQRLPESYGKIGSQFTDGTTPIHAARTPDSNSPSWFDVPKNSAFTALTRPRM